MTPEAQRIAIAVACGLGSSDGKWARSSSMFVGSWKTAVSEVQEVIGCYYGRIPDYLNDLNAMNEAEQTLASDQIPRYISELWEAVCRGGNDEEIDFITIHAASKYRAEAFLRIIGKWQD